MKKEDNMNLTFLLEGLYMAVSISVFFLVLDFSFYKLFKLAKEKAQKVLDVREDFSKSSLADLYDPLTMPPALVKAHQGLDKAVDLCYRSNLFPNDLKRIEFLFELYEKYTNVMFNESKKKKK